MVNTIWFPLLRFVLEKKLSCFTKKMYLYIPFYFLSLHLLWFILLLFPKNKANTVFLQPSGLSHPEKTSFLTFKNVPAHFLCLSVFYDSSFRHDEPVRIL